MLLRVLVLGDSGGLGVQRGPERAPSLPTATLPLRLCCLGRAERDSGACPGKMGTHTTSFNGPSVICLLEVTHAFVYTHAMMAAPQSVPRPFLVIKSTLIFKILNCG